MSELVNPPFRPAHFGPVLERLRADLEKNPVQLKSTCRTWAFLPSKAGAGASTLAAHTAWASAQNREARVLLADFDRYSGITSFQFNVVPDYTLQDALAASEDLDEDCWRRLVKPVRNIDLLVSRPADITENRLERFTANLFQFAQRNYTTILADLPDSLDTQTLSVLHQADQIFLVTTPELPSLRLAKLKADALRKLDLGSRTRLLLNRFSRNAMLAKDDISDAVGIEVFAEFPCDYAGVSESLRVARPAAKVLEAATGFVNAANIAANLPKRKKFIDRLSLPLTAYFRPTVPTSVLRS
jgi:pilus assembly protein CpaE